MFLKPLLHSIHSEWVDMHLMLEIKAKGTPLISKHSMTKWPNILKDFFFKEGNLPRGYATSHPKSKAGICFNLWMNRSLLYLCNSWGGVTVAHRFLSIRPWNSSTREQSVETTGCTPEQPLQEAYDPQQSWVVQGKGQRLWHESHRLHNQVTSFQQLTGAYIFTKLDPHGFISFISASEQGKEISGKWPLAAPLAFK